MSPIINRKQICVIMLIPIYCIIGILTIPYYLLIDYEIKKHHSIIVDNYKIENAYEELIIELSIVHIVSIFWVFGTIVTILRVIICVNNWLENDYNKVKCNRRNNSLVR
jgi:hypothetical protein